MRFLPPHYTSNGCIGNSTYAAITAIVAANAVLVAYIVMSLREERKLAQDARKPETKKTQ